MDITCPNACLALGNSAVPLRKRCKNLLADETTWHLRCQLSFFIAPLLYILHKRLSMCDESKVLQQIRFSLQSDYFFSLTSSRHR